MLYVISPSCGSQVEIPVEAVGAGRTDPWNVGHCDTFDYDDKEVVEVPAGD